MPYYSTPGPDAGVVDASTCDAKGQECDAGFTFNTQTCMCGLKITPN